jgi:hypothetical protein
VQRGAASRLDASHHITVPRATRPTLQSLLNREAYLDLQGHEGNNTSNNGTEGDDGAASSVEGGGGGGLSSRSSGGGASGLGVGGALKGAGANRAGHTRGLGSSGGGDSGLRADGGGDHPGADAGGGSSGAGAGLVLGAVGGGDIVNDGGNGQLGGGGSSGSGLGGGSGDSGGGGGGVRALSLGETELGGPLVGTVVLTGILNDDQETVVGDIGGEGGGGGPDERASVGDALSEGRDGHDVGGGAAQEDDGDSLAQEGIPLDGVGLALGDLLRQARGADGITLGRLIVVGGGVGRSEGREGSDESSNGEAHVDGLE